MLHPHCLLEYAGYGVWNVRGKKQRINPPTEWTVVENAHEALITEEEVRAIMEARERRNRKRFDIGYCRSKNSSYLLSGGLFVCGRCGSNLSGLRKTDNASYYICGSRPNRRGLGCGDAVYVPQREVESEVLAGLTKLLDVCSDSRGFTRQVNEELRRMWQQSAGHDPTVPHKLRDIETKLSNIRKAVEEGLPDGDWANSRMRELMTERDSLSEQVQEVGEAPQIDSATALAYRANVERVMSIGSNAEKKQLVRSCVDKMPLAPDILEVEITYKIPEAIGASCGSGGTPCAEQCFIDIIIDDVEVRTVRGPKKRQTPG